MYERMLRHMREKIRTRNYVMTLHAEEEMDDDGFSIFDVERAILTGHIMERQTDQRTGEWKYVLIGESLHAASVGVVVKLSSTDKLVIITVYREA